MVAQVRVWDRDRRGDAGPDFAVWPKDTPDEALPQGLIINKRYNRVTISWPAAASVATDQGDPHHPAEGALRVQLSFGPLYPHAENVCRVPAYLEHVLPLGEHREPGDDALLTVDDLAVTATRDRLHGPDPGGQE